LNLEYRKTEPSMHVQVVHPRELATSDLDQWESMQRESRGSVSPFLTPGFTAAVGRFDDAVRVAVVEESGRAVCYFPFTAAAGRVPACRSTSARCSRSADSPAGTS
jgi:CelD/BcsL family acetyltransferase involved in cellulose biosynthesis